jgi:hypothetical protein
VQRRQLGIGRGASGTHRDGHGNDRQSQASSPRTNRHDTSA